MKLKNIEKEIWWQWSWDFWRIGLQLNFDLNKYKYFNLKLWLLLFAVEIYFEW